ncbi:hypothetical protein SBOR_0398 [Sclerotinia borealis F-4128]|uniref:Uncharacterized protein n=1 Tax=Sclerotinia borealis (strain F-4128) TaxID=1432307 RepID=W9CTH6_SCLBF|nr:hypothetical protein SBOR_0398 [Sclerotinia borealis F-4128]
MANPNRRTPILSSTLLPEVDSPYTPPKRSTYRSERAPIIGKSIRRPVEGLPVPVKFSFRESPISRGIASSPRNVSNLPGPVSSSRTHVNNSPGPALSSRTRLVNQPGGPASSSRTHIGDSPGPVYASRTRFNNAKGAHSPDRSAFGPPLRSHCKTEITAPTGRGILPGSPAPASTLPARIDNTKGTVYQTRHFLPKLTAQDKEFLESLNSSPKKSVAPALSRRSQLGKLPYSASSPNINKLTTSNENIPPVPFAPKNELHERVLHGRRGSANTNNYYPHPLYSNPTVASSDLTASASSTDISQPRSKNQRKTERDFSKIPSPTLESRSRPPSRRHLHSPVRTVIEKGEESRARRRHISPVWGLPQIHPGRTSPGPYRIAFKMPELTPSPKLESASLPKSKTFGVFSTLKNSSSIQWLNSNRSTSNPSRAAEPTISTTKYSPIPEFTTNTLQVHTAQPSAYWCGRFQAVSDRYQTDDFDVCVLNPLPAPRDSDVKREKPSSHYRRGGKILQETSSQSRSNSPTPLLEKSRKKTPAKSHKTVLAFSTPALFLEDFDKRAQKVMVFLASLCCTSPAKKSLREWQIQYATAMKNKALMPKNDSDDKGFFGRMGRVISDGVTGNKNSTNGRGTGMGKRSAFGLRRGGRSAAGDH